MGNLEGKKRVVDEIAERLENAQSVVVVDYCGLTVAEVTDLRAKLRSADVEMKVLKNTMVKIAADKSKIAELSPYLQGPTAWVFSKQDPVSGPKVLLEFAKGHKNLEIKAGIIEKRVIKEQDVKALAELPSREVLLAQVLRGMQGPLTGMANVLQGPIRQFGYALEALRKQKAEA